MQHFNRPAVDRTLELRRRVLCVCYGQAFPLRHTIISYHDGKAIDRATTYFEGLIEGLAHRTLSAFLDGIWT